MSAATAQRRASRRSPFTGQLVHQLIGMDILPTARPPMFDDPVWDLAGLSGAPAQLKPNQMVFDFTAISNPTWQLVARELMIALLCPAHELAATLPMARRTPLHPYTCQSRLYFLVPWLQWLTGQGVTSLRQVTQEHCERYLQHLETARPASGSAMRDVLAIKDIARYGELFTADSYLPGFMPWWSRGANVVAGFSAQGENKTQPVPQDLLHPALHAGLHLVQTIGPHLVNLLDEIRAARPPICCTPSPATTSRTPTATTKPFSTTKRRAHHRGYQRGTRTARSFQPSSPTRPRTFRADHTPRKAKHYDHRATTMRPPLIDRFPLRAAECDVGTVR
jgi:hypothetical protein